MEAIADTSSTEREVRRLKDLQKQSRHEEAQRGAQELITALPENRDLLLIAASNLRHLGRIDEALAMLERLEKFHPRFSLMYQERGLCHVARKDAPKAIDALLRAVNINPALPMSWRMLEGVYRLTGDTDNAATAAAHVATLGNLPPDVVAATFRAHDAATRVTHSPSAVVFSTTIDREEITILLSTPRCAFDPCTEGSALERLKSEGLKSEGPWKERPQNKSTK